MSDSQPVAAPAPAPAASSAPKVPYVGSLISLISRSGIRYVGTLYTIDTKASTVALKDVKSFGTEGRHREEGPVEPSTHVYSFIIFRGPDILDLQFLPTPSRETTTDAVKPTQTTQSKSSPAAPEPQPVPAPAQQPTPQLPKPEPKESPPAVKSAPPPTPSAPVPAHLPTPRAWGPPPGQDLEAKKPQRSDEHKSPSVSGAQPVPARAQNSRRPLPADPSKRDGDNSQIQNGSNGNSSEQQLPHQNVPNGAGASTRNNQRPPNGRQNGGPNSSSRPRRNWRRGPGIKIPDEDFDFATMNSKFSKATIQSAENDGSTDTFPPVEVRYDKSKSFFDDLATDKTVGSDRTNAAQRRATDFETFGETGGYRHRSYRNRGRRNANRGRNRSGGRGYPYGSRPAPTRNDESERA